MPHLKRGATCFLVLMALGIFVLFAVLIVLMTSRARASTPSENLPDGVTCEQIRSLVALHGKIKALAWAMRNGYSWAEIKEAKKCLRQ